MDRAEGDTVTRKATVNVVLTDPGAVEKARMMDAAVLLAQVAVFSMPFRITASALSCILG